MRKNKNFRIRVVGDNTLFIEHYEKDLADAFKFANIACSQVANGLFGERNIRVVGRDKNLNPVFFKVFNFASEKPYLNCY